MTNKLIFSKAPHSPLEYATGFTELAGLATAITLIVLTVAKAQGLIPKENLTTSDKLYIYGTIFLGGSIGAMLSHIRHKNAPPPTHENELLGCLIGALFTVTTVCCMLAQRKNEPIQNVATNEHRKAPALMLP